MAEMLSPGVYSTLIDKSQVVGTTSSSTCAFAGNFVKGPVGTYTIISTRQELLDYYGYPTNENYNDFYQCYNFLGYGSNLLVSRAGNLNGASKAQDGVNVMQVGVVSDDEDATKDYTKIVLTKAGNLKVNDVVSFGSNEDDRYLIVAIDDATITLDQAVSEDLEEQPQVGDALNIVEILFNGSNEALSIEATTEETVNGIIVKVPNSLDRGTLFDTNKQIGTDALWEEKFDSIAFAKPAQAKLKFFSRNPGSWAKNIKICIARPDDFEANDLSDEHVTRYAFEGLAVDDYFEYAPKGTQVGVLIYDEETEEVVETYTVDFDEDAVDSNNKSTFIETVINRDSSYVFVKVNSATEDTEIASYTLVYDEASEKYVGKNLSLLNSTDSDIQKDDLLDAYEVFDNKEELDVDIVIANELDGGASAKATTLAREDCICIIGAPRDQLVGKKSAICTQNLIKWRNSTINWNSKYLAAFGNYKYQYDRYNDKYRWVNIAGDIAGLRAQTNTNFYAWYASAGIDRGQISDVEKLAFNPNQTQRDNLYKNSINPVVQFPGQGTVCWGQKTLQSTASSFDRINVVGLFNVLVRALTKMARSNVFEFNDTFTRNSICSTIKPYLGTVQSNRGITDYLVVCDESNNTADVISHNQLIVDIYIKPNYVAEFIHLKFTNAGTRSFSEVTGG